MRAVPEHRDIVPEAAPSLNTTGITVRSAR
ncbi:hypothetical protein J2S41_000405 [Catenuloplanes atrovinosus]|uniref:Uncharacterized protein n=1 Tax=Catenuloplanes atrovinosus TaxID=137266 RepID=A0AAE4C7L9_9ACTN|nr:hypothetical protein [Catenuloplanes atrovinosus]